MKRIQFFNEYGVGYLSNNGFEIIFGVRRFVTTLEFGPYGNAYSAGYRIVYPVDIIISAGVSDNNGYGASIALPIHLTHRFGVYFKTAYWPGATAAAEYENINPLVLSAGIFF